MRVLRGSWGRNMTFHWRLIPHLRERARHGVDARGVPRHDTASRFYLVFGLAAAFVSIPSMPAHATSSCADLGFNNFPHAKTNKLYVYFPAAEDSTFPHFGIAADSSPAKIFDVAD